MLVKNWVISQKLGESHLRGWRTRLFLKGALSKWTCIGFGSGRIFGVHCSQTISNYLQNITEPQIPGHILWQVYRVTLRNRRVRIPLFIEKI